LRKSDFARIYLSFCFPVYLCMSCTTNSSNNKIFKSLSTLCHITWCNWTATVRWILSSYLYEV